MHGFAFDFPLLVAVGCEMNAALSFPVLAPRDEIGRLFYGGRQFYSG